MESDQSQNKRTINIENINQTEKLAESLANLLTPGDTILLTGDLGAGKTTFTQFLGKSLGVKRHMTSPTFNIIKSYQSPIKNCQIHHMDCYRLEDSDEDLGFDEYLNGDSIVIIEWPQFIEDYWPDDYIALNLEHVDESSRKVTIGSTPQKANLVEVLYEQFTH